MIAETLAHATAIRALNETFEDYANAPPADIRSVFASRFAALMGMPVDFGLHPKPLPHRMTPREVRALVYAVADKMLPGPTVIELMNELDNAMALAASPAARTGAKP